MKSLKLSFTLFVVLGFLCVCSGNPITSLFGKSSDDKAEESTDVNAAPAAKSAGDTTTTTTTTTTASPDPSSSCGGLKGFLHMCDKNEQTEPPKTVKARSVDEESDSDSDSDSDSSEEKTSTSEPTEKSVDKRQVEFPDVPEAPEELPVAEDAPEDPEEEATARKRQTENSDSTEEDSMEENSRKRRDCRDRYGDYEKDCRKKRDVQPDNPMDKSYKSTAENF